ncbi:hypothetical protein O181_023340 [Austropuccinia psidii MF-1]|uniref:Uncharacterized protein n=1 Tax=Austropuccinia psidii MF-1 TaxID=1389203 RepID=A0A9Q3GZ00_9BASI|nr:hypothetical protein [Austropuccinia psidii MF-1]
MTDSLHQPFATQSISIDINPVSASVISPSRSALRNSKIPTFNSVPHRSSSSSSSSGFSLHSLGRLNRPSKALLILDIFFHP